MCLMARDRIHGENDSDNGTQMHRHHSIQSKEVIEEIRISILRHQYARQGHGVRPSANVYAVMQPLAERAAG